MSVTAKKSELPRIATYRGMVGELTATYKRTETQSVKITESRDAKEFIFPYYDEIIDDHEEFKVIHLNNSNKVINIDHHSKGTTTGTIVSTHLIFRKAILLNTVALILVHNHPSGSLRASEADKKLTRKIKKAAEYFDMNVLDHIIITREGYTSFSDSGIL